MLVVYENALCINPATRPHIISTLREAAGHFVIDYGGGDDSDKYMYKTFLRRAARLIMMYPDMKHNTMLLPTMEEALRPLHVGPRTPAANVRAQCLWSIMTTNISQELVMLLGIWRDRIAVAMESGEEAGAHGSYTCTATYDTFSEFVTLRCCMQDLMSVEEVLSCF